MRAKKTKLVYGIGLNDYDGRVSIDGKMIKSYNTWCKMLLRCYDSKYQQRNPTYSGCSVCQDWLSFTKFKMWYDSNYREGMALDKDLLIHGNKQYSPEACRFVPHNINTVLLDCGRARGELPLGVTKHGNGYSASCSNGYGKRLSKRFSTISEAVSWYSVTKTAVVKQVADKALADGLIGQDVHEALLARKF